MFKFLTVKEQLLNERRKSEALAAENARLNAMLEYVAMMADVEIPEGEDEGDE